MNDNLTIKTKTLALGARDITETGLTSMRLGVPGEICSVGQVSLKISHQDYSQSGTKVPGVQSNMRFQLEYVHPTTGVKHVAYAQLQVGRPLETTIPNADILVLVDCLRQMIATTSADAAALNLASDIYVTHLV